MAPATIMSFCKNGDCPPSAQLLDFQKGNGSRQTRQSIRQHLAMCDFCAAEVEFYDHFPQEDGVIEPAAIPRPLLQLAEALLGKNTEKALNNLFETESSLVA